MSELQLAMTAPGDFGPRLRGMVGLRRNRARSETRNSPNLARKRPQFDNLHLKVKVLYG